MYALLSDSMRILAFDIDGLSFLVIVRFHFGVSYMSVAIEIMKQISYVCHLPCAYASFT
jgi:hypothetical protein